jgi:hypothetical protein
VDRLPSIDVHVTILGLEGAELFELAYPGPGPGDDDRCYLHDVANTRTPRIIGGGGEGVLRELPVKRELLERMDLLIV